MRSRKISTILAIAVIVAALSPSIAIAGTEPELQAFEWRNIGPHAGVRGSGVAMHPTDRNVFYHAHSSGGVWKTEDAGQYWIPITDGQINVGAVGAIAISPTNPDIIYIGTGEPQLRDCVSWGDVVFTTGVAAPARLDYEQSFLAELLGSYPRLRAATIQIGV